MEEKETPVADAQAKQIEQLQEQLGNIATTLQEMLDVAENPELRVRILSTQMAHAERTRHHVAIEDGTRQRLEEIGAVAATSVSELRRAVDGYLAKQGEAIPSLQGRVATPGELALIAYGQHKSDCPATIVPEEAAGECTCGWQAILDGLG